MISAYDPCPCKSGKKFKFCCHTILTKKNSGELIKVATNWPVYNCWNCYETGYSYKVTVFVVRAIPNGNYILGCYLLDLLSIGIKDTFMAKNLSKSSLSKYDVDDERITKEFLSYQDARSLILGSLDFGKEHGYSPHEDWEETKCMIEPNDPYEAKFTFGINGKSLYIPTSHDRGF